jgi:hypothetical protein
MMEVSEKRTITIVVAFAVIAIALYLLSLSTHPLVLETKADRIDTNSTVSAVDIRVLNIDTIDHEVTVEVSSSKKFLFGNVVYKRVMLKNSLSLKPSTYEFYPDMPVTEESYEVSVIVDDNVKRTGSMSFTEVKVFEIEIAPETIDFGYVNTERVYLQEIYPDAVVETN